MWVVGYEAAIGRMQWQCGQRELSPCRKLTLVYAALKSGLDPDQRQLIV